MNQKNDDAPISVVEVRAAMGRILGSREFVMSERLGGFLRFTVERAIEGTASELKESIIGQIVYDRKPDYDPSQDSIVRSEARRLRGKLAKYYQREGKQDPVVIDYPLGRYVPVFHYRTSSFDPLLPSDARDGIYSEGAGILLAVLPFADLTGDPLSRECSRHISDELAHVLSNTDGCKVVASSSVLRVLSEGLDFPMLARKLGAQYVFEGTVRLVNEGLRVTANLVDATGFQIWSQRFESECNPQRFSAVAESMAKALVNRTGPELREIRKLKASVSPVLMSHYRVLLSAEALLDEGGFVNARDALAKFQEVENSVPAYARSLCGIAQCWFEIALSGLPNSASALAQSGTAALRALTLDPQMASTHASMACVQALKWNWDEAEASFERAIALSPYAGTYRQLGLFYAAMQRLDEGWFYLNRAQQMDPFSRRQKLACAKYFHLSRQPEEAAHHFKERLMFGPLPLEARLYLALLQIGSDLKEEALQETHAIQREAGGYPPLMAGIAENLALCGQPEAAMRLVEKFRLLSSGSPISFFRQALLSLAMGDTSGALSGLTRAAAEKEAECVWLAADPRFEVLRENSAFAVIIDRLPPPPPSCPTELKFP